MDLQEMLGVTVSSLEKFISTKTCVGEPIVIGDVTLILVQTVSFGYGSGGGEGKQTDQSVDRRRLRSGRFPKAHCCDSGERRRRPGVPLGWKRSHREDCGHAA